MKVETSTVTESNTVDQQTTPLERFEALIHSIQDDFEVRFKPLYQYLPSSELGLQPNIPFLLQLVTSEKRQQKDEVTNPLEVCVLLDISGSMAGEKLRSCKEAIVQLVKFHLKENDIFHLILYDDKINVLYQDMSPTKVDVEKIRAIESQGGTNISDAVIKGIEILKQSTRPHIKLLFLFSDGNANEGIIDINEFGKVYLDNTRDLTVNFNSFGIGSDYNERWLSSLARVGKGDYFYINDIEQVKKLLIKSLVKYRYQLGRNATIRVFGNQPNVLLAVNGVSDYESLIKGVKIGNMYCKDLKQAMFTLSIKDSSMPLFRYELSYESLPENQMKVVTGTFSYDKLSTNVNELLLKDDDGLVYQTILDAGALNVKVTEAMEQGNLDLTLQVKKQIIQKYKTATNIDKYGILTKLLENEEETLKDLENKGITGDTFKNQHLKSGFAAKLTRNTKCEEYEEDEDMDEEGFGGLF
ncbi:hypothetical protein ABK040_003429 [Willaertia magna]